jgi:guanine nucleotide-binding protein G(i) subunit alpha
MGSRLSRNPPEEKVSPSPEVEKPFPLAKVVMLGTGESGKTTIFKQMKMLYGPGITENEKSNYRTSMQQLIMETVQNVVRDNQKNFQANPEFQFSDEAKQASSLALAWKPADDCILTPERIQTCKTLWNDKGFKKTLENKMTVLLPPMRVAEYFQENIDRFAKGVETNICEEDLLLVRIRTTGLLKDTFKIDDLKFELYDTGGQRSERRKWIHTFEDMKLIVFIVSLGDYCERCFEDEKTNRMVESLNCFEEILNLNYCNMDSVPIVILFNKKDFDTKFENVPLSTFFTDWSGTSIEDACKYFINLFESKVQSPRPVYSYVFDATSADECKEVFSKLPSIIKSQSSGETS